MLDFCLNKNSKILKNNPDKSSENEKHVAIKIAFINFQELLLKKFESDV